MVARDEWSEGAEAVREGVAEAGGFRRNCFPWFLCARAVVSHRLVFSMGWYVGETKLECVVFDVIEKKM